MRTKNVYNFNYNKKKDPYAEFEIYIIKNAEEKGLTDVKIKRRKSYYDANEEYFLLTTSKPLTIKQTSKLCDELYGDLLDFGEKQNKNEIVDRIILDTICRKTTKEVRY